MQLPASLLVNGFDTFILIFIRMTGLFVIAPVFGRRNIPNYMKIGFALLCTFILASTAQMQAPAGIDTIYGLALQIFKEFMVGVTLGYVSYLIFTAIYLAGQIIDTQVGFGMVNVMDPVNNIQVAITSNFYFMLSLTIFLIINGHHVLIQALFDSFRLVPLGEATFNGALVNDIIRIFADTFSIGFRICAPVLAAIFLADVSLGVISKMIPQMNVYMTGMPLKIIIGVLVIVLTIPAFVGMLDVLVNGMNSEMYNFLKDMVMK